MIERVLQKMGMEFVLLALADKKTRRVEEVAALLSVPISVDTLRDNLKALSAAGWLKEVRDRSVRGHGDLYYSITKKGLDTLEKFEELRRKSDARRRTPQPDSP